MNTETNKIYTISEFVATLNNNLKATKVKITGEVGEAKVGPTGHVYFTLKDQKDASMLNCIIWSFKYRLFGINLEPGIKILAFGNPEVYAPNGRLSFVADTIELAGEGDLKKQYDELKIKLEKEGLFDVENKREIPRYPQKIGVITSKQGAVIHDFLNNIGKFGFKIKMIDSRVEGQGAVEDLLASIKTFRKKDLDVLVIIRGGGSMESLMPFNNEFLVREIVGFPVPVIVGIGHDKDVPLVCLAADASESTPTAVANLLNLSWQRALLLIERSERRIFTSYAMIFDGYKKVESRLLIAFLSFKNILLNAELNMESRLEKYFISFRNIILITGQNLAQTEKIVNVNNPEHQLSLGYSIATVKGKIIRRISQVKSGDTLEIKVSDGNIVSKVI